MIRVGIIGCGKIAQVRHLPEYAANPNAEIVAFYDKNMERAQEMAAQYGGKVYNSFYELVDDPTWTPCPYAWKTAAMRRSARLRCTPASTCWWRSPWR